MVPSPNGQRSSLGADHLGWHVTVLLPPREIYMSEDSVVVRVLSAEYKRIVSKQKGAENRLVHAHSQAILEEASIETCKEELAMLGELITSQGGKIPEFDAGEKPVE